MPSVHQFEIFADYFQFIVQDACSEDDFGALWADEAAVSMVAVGNAAVAMGTLRNVVVLVDIHILDGPPAVGLADADHAVEGAFALPTGQMVVMGCTDYLPDARRLSIRPGAYRFLYLVSGVHTIKTEWEPADDHYSLYIWPGQHQPTRVIKCWKPPAHR